MLRLRVVCPPEVTARALECLLDEPRVSSVTMVPGAAMRPPGDLITATCASDAIAPILRQLRRLGVPPDGLIEMSSLLAVVADPAHTGRPDTGASDDDAVIWEEVVARAGEESATSATYVILMALAGVIAAVGILTDNIILIVGAMIVSPDFGPVAALCVGLVERRASRVIASVLALAAGFGTASLAGLVTAFVFQRTGQIPAAYITGSRPMVELITHATWGGVLVALSAGVAGLIALGQAKSGALVGVLVSVTTIPAAANVGVAIVSGTRGEALAAALQLLINLASIVVGGVLTLVAVRRAGRRSRLRLRHPK